MLCCGVDGCPHEAWVIAAVDDRRELGLILLAPAFEEVLQRTQGANLVLIDVPIGLPDGVALRARACDREARRALGSRGSAVFPVPLREALHAGDRARASALQYGRTGKRIGAQTWGIARRIARVDEVLRRRPEIQARLRESHPELCFAALNGGVPLTLSKHTEPGLAMRQALLRRHLGKVDAAVEAAQRMYARFGVSRDDILDAAALAANALYGAEGALRVYPEEPEWDEYGLAMEIVWADVKAARKSKPTPVRR